MVGAAQLVYYIGAAGPTGIQGKVSHLISPYLATTRPRTWRGCVYSCRLPRLHRRPHVGPKLGKSPVAEWRRRNRRWVPQILTQLGYPPTYISPSWTTHILHAAINRTRAVDTATRVLVAGFLNQIHILPRCLVQQS